MDIVFLVVLFTIAWLIVKSLLFILSIKYKLNINFTFNRNYLKNVSILKFGQGSIEKSEYDIKIGKIWISSCYVNRNVNERLLICSSNINVKLSSSLRNFSSNRIKIPWYIWLYLNFFGSLNLENIELEMSGQQFKIKQIKLERNSKRLVRVILDDLDYKKNHDEFIGNKFLVSLSPDFETIEFEGDKINLNINLMNYLSGSTKSQNFYSKWLKSIKSIRINKLTLNKRQVFNHLEIYSTNLDYLKINLNCLNDLTLSKNTRLVDNLLIEIFNTGSIYDLVFKCDQSNFYFYLDEIEYALNKFRKVAQNENGSKFSKLFRLEFKLNNFYVSLIDRVQNDIYVLGSSLIDLNTNLKNLIKFECKNFVLFKSSQKPIDKYSNNLFCQSSDLVKLFQWINYKKFNYPGPKRQYEHVWGNLINCNLVKFRFKLTRSKRKIVNIFADQLYIEHSIELFDHILSFISNSSLSNKTKRESIFNLRLNQINLIHIFEKKYFLHFSLEELSLKKYGQLDAFAKSFSCFDTRLTKLSHNESQYSMNQNTINHQKENEKKDLIFLLKSINLNRIDSNYSISMEEALITWSLKSHFTLNETFFNPIRKYLKMFEKDSNPQSHSRDFGLKIFVETNILVNFLFDYSQDSSKKLSLRDQDSGNYRYFNSNIKLIDTLSFTLNKFYYFYSNKMFNLNISEVCSFVNTYDLMSMYPNTSNDSKSHIFLHAHNISVCTDDQNDYLLAQRQNVKTQILKNKILFAKFELVHLIFLFQYDFAKMIDHILNLRKVLYKIHQVAPKKIELNPKEALSVDFVLSIKQIKLVIEDDPFEVKLSYNYSLIADEYMESLKRRQSLDQRRSIRENNLENQALEILLERESRIYIQRSKMVYSSLPRKELFCICIENLELKALSDSEWHGRQKCYEILRKIDQCSPPPPKLDHNTDNFEPALNYLILWCRHIDLCVQDLKFLFRDYTQPFLKINGANFFGKFLASEYQVPFKSKRQVKICVSSELSHLEHCVFEIERYMSPIKFYHDLSSKMAVLHYAYGPCWEGCMAQLNLSLEKIIHPARDPSKPLPWWDKSRLYLHGRLTACVQQCHIIYHVSMDPYNRTEEMRLVWSPLNFDWKNMELSFDGGLDIFLNTESKYDDCLLLHLPNLNAKIKIEWLCKTTMFNKCNEFKTNSNGHNLVVLHAPDKLPLIVNSFEHDSYSQFRSEGLNLFFSFQCRQDNSRNVPTCKFYASTSRFLQKIKNLLSAITRPTKRGNLFGNKRPKKAILSRHFKRVSFTFDLTRINIIYWSSASEQYGIQLESEDYFMNSSFKLDLVPFADKLKRRHKPNWSIQLMKFSVKQTNISLMSPGNANSGKTTNQNESDPFMLEMNERSIKFLDSKPAVKNFFMRIDSITYEREKSCNYNFYSRVGNESANETLTSMSMSSLVPIQVTNCPKHNLSIRNLKAKWNTVNRDVVYILFEIYNKSNRLRQNLSAHILKQYDLFTDQLLQNHILSQYKNQQRLCRKSSELSNGGASVKNKVGTSGENQFEELLKKLDHEKKLNSNVFCGDMPLNQSNWHFDNLIYGFHSTNRMGDILSENVSIQLINSQIKLNLDDSWQNDESFLSFIPKPKRVPSADKQQEYVIISAARANVVQHLHKPVWKSQRCLEKISWSGHLENMQYFATLNNKDVDSEYWLSQELINPTKDLPQNYLIQHGCQIKETRLQLIVPKCHCEFYLVGFYDQIPDDSLYIQNTASTFNLSNLLNPNAEPKTAENCQQYLLDLNPSINEPIDCFTLIHHDVSLA